MPLVFTTLVGSMLFLTAGCGLWCLWNGARSRKWPTAPGVVLHSDIECENNPDGGGFYRARILYRYEVNSREFQGKRVYFGQTVLWTSSFERLLSKTGRYHPGSPAKVHFHSNRPSLCVLQPGVSFEAWVVTIIGCSGSGAFLYAVLAS